ncbi:MAG: hypothetical protein KJ017_08830 [Alphaproteobacteria bacterium]|nr:hypothetical protein [Alphaproteobacteria bacterium]
MKYPLFVFTLVLGIGFCALPAQAQMNNKPFSFKGTPDGGVGMSMGGKQAILNQEIFGSTPKNMIRGADGQLLNLTMGEGRVAIVSNEGNSGFLPGFKGSSFRGDNPDMSYGVFNTFFSPRNNDGISSSTLAALHTGSVISTWTARVATGSEGISFLPSSSVDNWTAMVDGLQ